MRLRDRLPRLARTLAASVVLILGPTLLIGQVATLERIEISGKGLLRPPTAGLDIHGDLSLTGFRGSVARKPFEATGEREIFTEIRDYLGG